MDKEKIDLFEPIGGKGSLPVYPIKAERITFMGLTKREYFAAMAMQGLLNSETFNANGYTNGTAKGIAIIAVSQADALIEALNK